VPLNVTPPANVVLPFTYTPPATYRALVLVELSELEFDKNNLGVVNCPISD